MGRFLPSLSAAWLSASVAGLLMLADYDSRPGDRATPPQQWPTESARNWPDGTPLTLNATKPTVMMFVHPRCPCSLASLHELSRLAASDRDRLEFHVVFVQPVDAGAAWSETDIWKTAAANRDLHVVADRGGSLAGRFGVKTSGQVLVYDGRGTLRFDGGITPGRGHAGDSSGRSLVMAIAEAREPLDAADCSASSPNCANCATFGCPLFNRRE